MKKTLLILPLLALIMLASVSAFCMKVPSSYRRDGGTLNYIGDSYYDTNLIASKIDLSYWTAEGQKGLGSLGIIAKNPAGERIVFNIKMYQMDSYLYELNGKFYVHYEASGKGTYWKQGLGTLSIDYPYIYYDYEIGAGLTDIWGYGNDGISFRASDIPTKGIW